jgi:hypothetical protein
VLVLKLNLTPSPVEEDVTSACWRFSTFEPAEHARHLIAERVHTFADAAEAVDAHADAVAQAVVVDCACTVNDFLQLPEHVQRHACMFQPAEVHFEPPAVPLSARVEEAQGTNTTEEQVSHMAWAIGVHVASGAVPSCCPPACACAALSSVLASYQQGACHEHRIPHDLLCDAVAVRTHALAGVIDGASRYDADTRSYVVSSPHPDFLADVAHLARGIGLRVGPVTKSPAAGWSMSVCGAVLSRLPVHSPVAMAAASVDDASSCGFSVHRLDGDLHEYFGFETDANHRFLLHDCTVTHNTADLLYSDGGYYKGSVSAQMEAHGKGILYTSANTIVQGGLFQHGKLHGEGFTNHPDGGQHVHACRSSAGEGG